MESPWMAEGQGTGYVVPNLAQSLQARNAANANAVANIGTFAGGAIAAGVGAQQASQDPGAFGAGTSPGKAAVLGGLMNFSNATQGGGGGGSGVDMNGFARLVNGGGSGGGGAPGTNFASFAAAGKMADATRNLLKENTPTLPNQDDVPVMGYTDDQWQHLGTNDKVQAFQAMKTAMDQRNIMQGYDLGQAHLASTLLATHQAQTEATANNQFNQLYQAATANGQTIDGPGMMKLAAQAGMNPQTALTIGKEYLDQAKATKALTDKDTFFDSTDAGTPVPGIPGLIRIPTGPNTSEIRDTTGNVATPVTDEDGKVAGYTTANGKGGTIFKPIKAAGAKFSLIPDQFNPGQMIPSVQADNIEDFKAGLAALKQMKEGDGGDATAPAGSIVMMTDQDGNTVKVPAERQAEFAKKGYTQAAAAPAPAQ